MQGTGVLEVKTTMYFLSILCRRFGGEIKGSGKV